MYEEYRKFLGPVRPCLICGTDADGESRETWAVDEYFKALRCQSCGLVTIEPSLNEEGLSAFYSNYIQRRFDNESKMQKRQVQYTQDLSFLYKHITEGVVLDVGCNGGFFLAEFDEKFQKYGIEIDEEAVKHARDFYGLDVRFEKFGEDTFEADYFDLVVFRGVIEHMYDPKSALQRAHEVLKPGGLLFFTATPNLDCLCAEVYREKWNVWHPIEHINIFSADTLHSLLGREHFELLAADYPYLGTPYEDQEKDTLTLLNDIDKKMSGRWDEVKKSPPFWGNMMSVIYKKL